MFLKSIIDDLFLPFDQVRFLSRDVGRTNLSGPFGCIYHNRPNP